MTTSDISRPSPSASDCCFTGIAVMVLLGQGSWSLVKRSAYEGWLTCKTGWGETHKAVHQIYGATTQTLEWITEIITYVLKEVGHLFEMLKQETAKTFFSTLVFLRSAAECINELTLPLAELGGTCIQGAHKTKKALHSFGHSCVQVAELFSAVVCPVAQEIGTSISAGMEGCVRMGGELKGACRTAADVSRSALEGIVNELIALFVKGLEISHQTAHAAQNSIKSWLSVSRESGFRLFLESSATCTVGYSECMKTYASLPPALKAFFQMPYEGMLSLLKECADTLKRGEVKLPATYRSIHHAARVGKEVLNATLVALLQECIDSGKIGLEIGKKTLRAVFQAIDHGTENLRCALLAIFFEGMATLSYGKELALNAAHSIQQAVLEGGRVIVAPCKPLLKECISTLSIGGNTTFKAIIGSARAVDAATAPLLNVAYRAGMEAFYSLRLLANQFCASKRALMHGVHVGLVIMSDGLSRIAHEVGNVVYKGLQEIRHFNYQMSHEVSRSLDVFVFHPIEKCVYPKMQSIRATCRRISARVNAILVRFNLA